jgi:hypothetical protein
MVGLLSIPLLIPEQDAAAAAEEVKRDGAVAVAVELKLITPPRIRG